MPKLKYYKIKLTPIHHFFFGGEIVFGNEYAQGSRRQSYLVKSRLFPQQTSLLGMLREQLLRKNGLLKPWGDDKNSTAIDKKTKAVALIGQSGFKISAASSPVPFGCIHQLFPLFLEDENHKAYYPQALDDAQGEDEDERVKNLKWIIDNPHKSLKLKYYNPKKELELHFANKDGDRIEVNQLFAKQEQVGVRITNRNNWRTNDSDKEGFFRKTSYKNRTGAYLTATMQSDPAPLGCSRYLTATKETKTPPINQFSFCFLVAVDASIPERELWDDDIVNMGGERSVFKMEVTTSNTGFDEAKVRVKPQYNTSCPEGYDRIALLSNAYLPKKELNALGVFTLAKILGFRFFTTDLGKTEHFYNLRKDKQAVKDTHFQFQKPSQWDATGLSQSKHYNLLQKGGVLLVPKGNTEALTNLIQSQKEFRQIGYNFYQKLS